jgi:hypothetical protein
MAGDGLQLETQLPRKGGERAFDVVELRDEIGAECFIRHLRLAPAIELSQRGERDDVAPPAAE